MEKYRAIPQGFMTVGQLAKRMNTTVRTLQYYDKEGLLSPSGESEGGRRLYTDKDVILLHQIQSMKYLGFSLEDIKNRLVTLDTPEQVAAVLTEQANAVREKIASLSDALDAIEKLKVETMQMKTVDFRKYADIVKLLQMGSDKYWAVKHFDDKMWAHIRNHFDDESADDFINRQDDLFAQATKYSNDGISPNSEQGIAFANTWWELLMEFCGGDMSLFPEMMKFGENRDGWGEEWKAKWERAEPFITAALEAHFTNLGINPFEGVSQ